MSETPRQRLLLAATLTILGLIFLYFRAYGLMAIMFAGLLGCVVREFLHRRRDMRTG